MPPAYGLGVLHGDNITHDSVFQQQFVQEHIVRAISQDVTDGEQRGRCVGRTIRL
jgi:hypothetical protein